MTRAAGGVNQSQETGNSRGAGTLGTSLGGYWHQSELPLHALAFLLPMIVIYEAGTRFFTAGATQGQEQQVIAFTLLRRFFSYFGAEGRHLPALAIVFVLLVWHIARKDAWRISLQTLGGMAVESSILALPLLVMGYALAHYFPLAGVGSAGPARMLGATSRVGDDLILVLGAGVYEEMVFRLIVFTVLSLILQSGLGLRSGPAGVIMVLASGLLFSAYHYLSPYEEFRLQTFAFRAVAGIYFGVVFLTRGFGITAGCHAGYDLFIVGLTAASS